MHVICESPASESLQCEWDQVLGWDDTTGQSNLQQFLLLILCWRQVYALGLVGWRALRKENEYFTKLDYWLLIWCVWWTQVSVGNFQDKRYCMHEVHSTLFLGHRQGYRKQTTGDHCYDANQRHKSSLARRKDAQALLVEPVSLRAAVTTKGRHQHTSSLRQHQR